MFWCGTKSWDLYPQTQHLCILTSFTFFFFMFCTYYVIFSEIFALVLALNFKTKVLTAQKNQLLECLWLVCLPYIPVWLVCLPKFMSRKAILLFTWHFLLFPYRGITRGLTPSYSPVFWCSTKVSQLQYTDPQSHLELGTWTSTSPDIPSHRHTSITDINNRLQ